MKMCLFFCLGVSVVVSSSRAPTGPLLFSANFSSPLDLTYEADIIGPDGKRKTVPTSQWVLESQSNKSVAFTTNGSMEMINQDSHMVLWCNQPFPANYELRFHTIPNSTEVGLNIVFFSTTAIDGSPSIFSLHLPPRNGDYKKYHSGALNGYSHSYYRAQNGTCEINPNTGHCDANLRKNYGFHLVQQGDDLIIHRKPKNGEAFHVAIRKQGATVTVSVDGGLELAWTDNSTAYGGGFIGLRQMAFTGSGVYKSFQVYGL
jgi:hypothetical protein